PRAAHAASACAQATASCRLAWRANRIGARVAASSSTTRTRMRGGWASPAGARPLIFRLGRGPTAARFSLAGLGYTLAGFSMKKLAIGCGIVLVIAVVAGGIGSYYLLHKAQSMFAGFSELKVVPDLERQVRNSAAFTPPASGELSADQVARYVAVREQ